MIIYIFFVCGMGMVRTTLIILLSMVWWLRHAHWQNITIQPGLIQSSALIDSNYTPINFIAPGNDFAGGIVWLTNKRLDNPVNIVVSGVGMSCSSQIRGLYFNSQRGERFWPLDPETAADFGWTGVGLTIDGWWYTDCETADSNLANGFIEYSIFGIISYSYNGVSYSLVAGVAMDYANNSLWSNWINGLQYINNQTPAGYIYDSAGGIGFVGGRVGTDPNNEIEDDVRIRHQELIATLSAVATNINEEVSQSWSWIRLFNIGVMWYISDAAVNTRLWFSVLGTIGIGYGYTDSVKRSILGNPGAQSSISEIGSVNTADWINQARKNAARLCRGVTHNGLSNNIRYSDEVICVNDGVSIDIMATATINGDNTIRVHGGVQPFDIWSRTIVVPSGDVYIDGRHGPSSTPLELFVEWNVYVRADASDRVNITGSWFPTNLTSFDTQWLFYKMILITNGLLMGADASSAISHKLYIHGKIATLNTAADSRDARDQQVNLTQLPAPPSNGLIAHYTFDDSNNLGNNSVSNMYDANIINSAWVVFIAEGKVGGSVELSNGGYLDAGDVLDIWTSDRSYGWRIKHQSPSQNMSIISKSVFSGQPNRYWLVTRNNQLSYWFSPWDPPGFQQSMVSWTELLDGLWNHVFVTIDRDGMMWIFVNGINVYNVDVSWWSTVDMQSGYPFRIGAYNGSNLLHYTGEIDDVRIYNRALSPTEVQAIYNWDFVNPVSFARLFSRRCNPSTGEGPDGAACDQSDDQFALIPFVVIDQNYASRLLQQ